MCIDNANKYNFAEKYQMTEEDSSSIKHLHIENRPEKESVKLKQPPRKKIASQTDHWINTAKIHSTRESQLGLLQQLVQFILPSGSGDGHSSTEFLSSANILLTHLKTKQSGYRSQDTIKGIYDPTQFVEIGDIIRLLIESNLSCFYCRKWTMLFYENVRDSRQWSLERLFNKDGHNRDNLVIACLECNMRRRTMYYERYIATKQLKVNKLGSEEDLSGIVTDNKRS